MLEMDLTACGEDGFAHGRNDVRQPVGSDVGMGVVQNRRVGTVPVKSIENSFVVPSFLGSGIKLAVGKGTGTTFTEGIVGFAVEDTTSVQGRHILATRRYRLTPLDHHRLDPQLDEAKGGKQALPARHRRPPPAVRRVCPDSKRSAPFREDPHLRQKPAGSDGFGFVPDGRRWNDG